MKHPIKEKILSIRNSIPKKELLEKSTGIAKSLFDFEPYKKSKTVMFFVSFNNEVYTHDIIKKALNEKTVVIPKVAKHEIEPSLIIDFNNLIEAGKFGILEPIEAMPVPLKKIDAVLVPGIVFDRRGYRIGYGFGYYDKFLKKVPKAVKIGLAFEFQIVDEIPKEEHDVAVDFIITEERIIECRE